MMSRKIRVAFALLFAASADAAHSRRRFVSRSPQKKKYDRSITTFSPDGRLEQVEYGLEASMRGSPAVVKRTGELGACIVVQPGKIYRLDHHVFFVAAGLSGDARLLASTLRVQCQQHRIAYGEPPRCEQVARLAGQIQHQLTYTGGARPLGCSGIVVGIDPSPSGELGTPRVFQTDPGGVVEEVEMCAVGNGRDEMMKLLEANLESGDEEERKTVIEEARSVASIVCEELGRKNKKNQVSAEVWTIEPDATRRGGMLARCYRKFSSDSTW